ncbi:MAG TPA: tetratricopeptide repeat protein [Casimicrobiaceae bacterium]|nr:tetratricopeptide repeat protein [Casimicrobiaceae bacterium]
MIMLAGAFALPAGARSGEGPLDTAWLDRAWDFDRPAESEARFREKLDSLQGAPRLELLTQIARAQGLQREFAAAQAMLDGVARELAGTPPRVAVRCLLERGRVFNSSGQPERSLPLFREALDQARDAGEDFLAIDAAHMLGIAAPPEERLQWNLAAVAMTEATRDARAKRWLASLYNNIGWTYHDRGEYAIALAYFEKALPAWQARADARGVRIAYWSIARAERSLGRLDEALAIQERLERECAAAGEPDGYVYEELGEIMLAKGDSTGARRNFAQAHVLLGQDKGLQAGAPERLARLKRLGGVE